MWNYCTWKRDIVWKFSNNKLKWSSKQFLSLQEIFQPLNCLWTVHFFYCVKEGKKCMDFCSIRLYLEGNKEINKKQGNYYLSTCLRNKGT